MTAERYVVVSAEPERRRDWAELLERDGAAVTCCPGPRRRCPLVVGDGGCTLLDGAQVAIYDLDDLTPELLPILLRTYADRSLLFAHDTLAPSGRHQPSVKRFVLGGAPAGSCFAGS